MTRRIQRKEVFMQTLKITMLAAGMMVLASCANMNPILVGTSAVCRDGWYGYWHPTCQPAPPAYGLAEAEQDIGTLKDQVGALRDQLATARQLIADLGENQASLRSQLNLVKAERELNKALQAEISRGTVSVIQSGDSLTINLNSSMLFDPGQDQLSAVGLDALKRVGSILKDFPDRPVHVAGYTDATPIRGALQKKFPSNQELSDARAHNALQALQDGGRTSNVSAEGRGADNPIASNDTAAGRAKNRRVEVHVL
jgi:chemotaxis protein MotB